MKQIYVLVFSIFFVGITQAQQTENITVMTYNLLNYRNFTSYCPVSQNNPVSKESWLKTIVQHVQPTVLVCNEIGGLSATNAEFLLTNSLNTNGVNYYQKASYTNNSFSSLVNMLFYDSRKLALYSQATVTKNAQNQDLTRVIDVYRLFYKDSLLTSQSDTVWFYVVAAHLKAGNTAADANQRGEETAALMAYIQSFVGGNQNVIMCGDLNLYKSQEVAYQNLTQGNVPSIKFYDPLNAPGVWSNTASFAQLHTQSTRSSNSNGGCFSTGGLDDRFDHILITDEVRDNLKNMAYIPNSYYALGNDGNKFNQDINNGTNNSVPALVLNAIYNMSDHLPVVAEFALKRQNIGTPENQLLAHQIVFSNPVADVLNLRIANQKAGVQTVRIVNLAGQQVVAPFFMGDEYAEINVSHLPAGMYLLEIKSTNGIILIKKLSKL